MRSCAAGLLAVLATCALAPLEAAELRIVHVTLVSPERSAPLRDATVTIRHGRIAAIAAGKGAAGPGTVLDGSGLYLAPGLIDSHVHLGAIPGMTPAQEEAHPDIALTARAQIPRSYLYAGFTTLIDLVSTPEQMARWQRNAIRPDTYFCGAAALMDGYPMNYAPPGERYAAWPYMLIEPGTAAPAGMDAADHTPEAVVRRMKADGAICVKSFFERGFGGVHDLPVPRPQTVRALVQAAHAQGMPVLLHANSAEAQAFGLDTGVDILAHGLWNADEPGGGLTPSLTKILDGVIEKKVGWQPTLQVLHGLNDLFEPQFLDDPRLTLVLPRPLLEWYRSPEGQWFHDAIVADLARDAPGVTRPNFGTGIGRAAAATGYLARHGGRLLFGTDTPSAPTYANPPGLNAWLEMQDLIAAGVTPAQVFANATLHNAAAFGLSRDIGTIAVGKRANLLLLHGDPRQGTGAYAGIVKVILDGQVLDPRDLAAR